jgi:hypothetical protein
VHEPERIGARVQQAMSEERLWVSQYEYGGGEEVQSLLVGGYTQGRSWSSSYSDAPLTITIAGHFRAEMYYIHYRNRVICCRPGAYDKECKANNKWFV